MTRLLALLAFAIAAPAFARQTPSFDCTKAAGLTERTICASTDLAGADREMAAIYRQLLGRLSGAAREHLIADQLRWLAARDKVCTYEPARMGTCLWDFHRRRNTRLKELGQGSYPFVGTYWLIEHDRIGNIFYRIDAAWPHFDGTTADFSDVNRSFAARARESAAQALPDTKAGRDAAGQEWSNEQTFELSYPGPRAVAVSTSRWTRIGGEASYGGIEGALVDLRTGRFAGPADVFNGDWLDFLTAQVRSKIASVDTGKLKALLQGATPYHYRVDRLDLIFEPGAVAPEAEGRLTVTVPYAALPDRLRVDGPLGR